MGPHLQKVGDWQCFRKAKRLVRKGMGPLKFTLKELDAVCDLREGNDIAINAKANK